MLAPGWCSARGFWSRWQRHPCLAIRATSHSRIPQAELREATKPSQAQIDAYKALTEQYLELEAEKSRSFVAEAAARREAEGLRMLLAQEQALRESEVTSLTKSLETLRADRAALESKLASLQAQLTAATDAFESQTAALKAAHKEQMDTLRRCVSSSANTDQPKLRLAVASTPEECLVCHVNTTSFVASAFSHVILQGKGRGGVHAAPNAGR